jgi:ABC-2 type transport system ATP-binding protein
MSHPGILDYYNVTKDYRSLWPARAIHALDGFTLSLERGEIFGFLGRNGAGKTTAIHIALGLLRPSSGNGQLLSRPFGHAATRARVGFVPENVALYHRPAIKLLRFYGALNRLRDPQLRKRCDDVFDEVTLQAEAHRNVGTFSRGMQQRIALAQALLPDPQLLILDEPTAALDPPARLSVRKLLLRAKGAGKTVLLSSHLLSEIEMICDRIGILDKGRLVKVGKTAELLISPDRCQVVVRGLSPEEFTDARAHDGLLIFDVPVASQRELMERVWMRGGEVVSLNPRRRTLEEAFLEYIGESGQAQ